MMYMIVYLMVVDSHYKSYDDRLWTLYNFCCTDANSVYNYIEILYSVLGCNKSWNPGYTPILDRLNNINN